MAHTEKPSTNPVVVAYVRVSTEEQANEGVSLDAQQARIRAYCQMRGLDLAEIVIDAGVSAGKPLAARDGGSRILSLVRGRKVAGIVALKLDRLFRDCADCLTVVQAWDKAGVALHLVDLGGQAVDTASAMGRFFLTVMAGAAELERNQVRERTSMAMRHLAALGKYTGGHARFGYAVGDDGVLVAIPAEQAVVSLARRLRGKGMSLRAVAQELARRGRLSRTEKPFVPCQIAMMTSRTTER